MSTIESEKSRLAALTTGREPEDTASVVARVREIRDHADERAAFYAPTAADRENSPQLHDIASSWGELATEADYRAEKIEAGTWAWA